MIVDAGRLNRRVSVQRRAQAPGPFGHPVDVWEPVMPTAWANIRPISGRERLASGAVQSSLSHTILMRYNAALVPELEAARWRIVYGARTFNVLGARTVDEGRAWIIFDCEEGGADGA